MKSTVHVKIPLIRQIEGVSHLNFYFNRTLNQEESLANLLFVKTQAGKREGFFNYF